MSNPESSRKRGHEDERHGNGEANKRSRYSSESESCSESPEVEFVADKTPLLAFEHVDIEVGEYRRAFSVPMKQLYSSSKYFKRIFSSDWWQERGKKTFPLVGCHTNAFKIYTKWLSYCKIEIHDTWMGEQRYTDEELFNICRCYKLAALIEDDEFKDAMIDELINSLAAEDSFIPSLPTVIYNNSAARSPHRRFVVDTVINTWSPDSFLEMSQETYPYEFLLDLAIAMGSKIRTGVSRVPPTEFFKDFDSCKYHEHTKKDAPCYKDRLKTSSEPDDTPCKLPILSAIFAQTNVSTT
ncbi:hypothetical protein yc1106_07568 [Curvularia clavata]|uniref:BTB domain-containing protein n=1 Tax=Curvularia clavata TaxID=95742 RepID=A0A9Q8ZCW1_CURCL|nr:hypothetical protein yc1106_07568 [Curvularia clavata]